MIAHYSSPISGHLSSKHGVTITEYWEKYQQHAPADRPRLPIPPRPPRPSPAPSPAPTFASESTGRVMANKIYKETGAYPWYECRTTICQVDRKCRST